MQKNTTRTQQSIIDHRWGCEILRFVVPLEHCDLRTWSSAFLELRPTNVLSIDWSKLACNISTCLFSSSSCLGNERKSESACSNQQQHQNQVQSFRRASKQPTLLYTPQSRGLHVQRRANLTAVSPVRA